MDSRDLLFSGRIFVYSENDIEDYKLQELEKQISAAKWRIQYRGPRFAEERSKTEKPLAFISHDSRDKDAVARPIAERLRRLMCPVWFDEYSLRVGDSLRESIETGIRECSRCILIISPNFLSNSGWTKSEFDSFFTRELLEEKKLILPVWYKVTKQDIFNYSTSLPDRVGLNWETIGADETIRRLYRALTSPGK